MSAPTMSPAAMSRLDSRNAGHLKQNHNIPPAMTAMVSGSAAWAGRPRAVSASGIAWVAMPLASRSIMVRLSN